MHMPDFKDRERLDALRQRLYDRNQDASFVSARRTLARTDVIDVIDVARGWGESVMRPAAAQIPQTNPVPAQPAPKAVPLAESPLAAPELVVAAASPRRRSYRAYILLASVAIFVVLVGISSFYLFIGGNQTSGRNISFALSAPLAVAGGDVLEVQAAIHNMNSVAIESATLIVNYPVGTKSVGDTPRDLFEDRIPLNSIEPGETKTVPVRAAVFGEENEEKEITATFEYRVAGSNGTFYKDADPITFTINSSPVVLRVESVSKISSGQEFDVTLVVQSNALTPLTNVLVSAVYPESFRFVRSDPEPSYRQSEWIISDLAAKGTERITIRGVASGLSDEEFLLRFQAGTPRTDNQFIVGSLLAQTSSVITVEKPFVEMEFAINSDTDGDVVLPAGSPTTVVLTVTNTRSEPVYDMRVRIVPKGTAFRERLLQVEGGVYESSEQYIEWDVSGTPELTTVLPGERREFRFRLDSDAEQSTASLDLDANVYARRVNERNVPEDLIGATEAAIRYSSVAVVSRQVDRERGPVPPVVGQETVYTLTLAAEAGSNDLTGAVVTTALPQHVRWLNVVSGDGGVEFNPVSKRVRWNIGEIKGKERRTTTFQVAMTPSVLQVGTTPVIMETQELQATDRFTGAPLQASAPPITAELSEEAGFERGNGLVQERPEDE